MKGMMQLNHLAVITSAVAIFFLGFAWYTKLFGRAWAREMGFPEQPTPGEDCSKMMKQGMLLSLVGAVLSAYVYASLFMMWKFAVPQMSGQTPTVFCALGFALCLWVGFCVPYQLGKKAWEMKSWKLVAINLGHDFIKIALVMMILWFWN
jgi:hypothetical protein